MVAIAGIPTTVGVGVGVVVSVLVLEAGATLGRAWVVICRAAKSNAFVDNRFIIMLEDFAINPSQV